MFVHSAHLNGDTREGRLYRFFKSRPGEWFTTMQATIGANVSSMSTSVSALRRLLPADERIEMKEEHVENRRRWFYRWVQTDMPPAPVPSSRQCDLF